MTTTVKSGDQGPLVNELQTLLMQQGYLTNEEISGAFGGETARAVRVFQSQNLDANGQPLVVDGKVGPLTWWSLRHEKPSIQTPSAIDFLKMPPKSFGGSKRGRTALAVAMAELAAGAGEVGGDNHGPFVHKYLRGIVPDGNPWCAGFVSYCFKQPQASMPFPYSVGARKILRHFKSQGWAHAPGSGHLPEPGDIVVWWRESMDSGKGHIGLVHQALDGFLYTIEGNRSPMVQGFTYVLGRMDKLLGFGRVPD